MICWLNHNWQEWLQLWVSRRSWSQSIPGVYLTKPGKKVEAVREIFLLLASLPQKDLVGKKAATQIWERDKSWLKSVTWPIAWNSPPLIAWSRWSDSNIVGRPGMVCTRRVYSTLTSAPQLHVMLFRSLCNMKCKRKERFDNFIWIPTKSEESSSFLLKLCFLIASKILN